MENGKWKMENGKWKTKQTHIERHHNKCDTAPSVGSVRANEVGSLTHELGSVVGSMVDIDRCTAINNMPLRLLWALCELTK